MQDAITIAHKIPFPGKLIKPTGNRSFLEDVVFWSWRILLVVSFLQVFIFTTLPNIVAIACVLFCWRLMSKIFLQINILKNYPLSSFLIIGYASTQFFFPALFTLSEGKPIVFNLELPYEVFFHSTADLLVLILVHGLYRSLPYKPGSQENSLLKKTGMFEPPQNSQLWLMGLVGIGATFYVYLYSPNIGWEVTGSASDKIIQAMMPFSYAPFFIPFSRMYGNHKPLPKSLALGLAAFTLLLFLVSIGRNSRGGFMIGFTAVSFAYFMGLMLNQYTIRILTLKNSLIAIVLFWLFTGPVADIGTAMVLVRATRMDISYTDLIESTFKAYGDKEAIRLYRLSIITEKADWDENYLDNIITARFANLKFNDASLVQAQRLPNPDPYLFQFSKDYMLVSLPQPFLDALDIKLDKKMLRGISFGDYLFYRAGGPEEALGGYRTGSMAGTGLASFGFWYLLLLGMGIFPVFILFDQFFIKRKQTNPGKSNTFQISFSVCGMLALDSVFRFLPTESVVDNFVFLMRDWIQMVLLYLLIYHTTRLIVSVFPKPGSASFYKKSTVAISS